MDLVDIISEKKFLGQEFLTWLWYKSEERGGAVDFEGRGDILVTFEKYMLLEYGEGEASDKMICRGLQTELKEARTGLRTGKKLEQARIHLAKGDYEWNFTLIATLLEFRNLKCPKTMTEAEEAANDPAAVEGKILERVGLIEEVSKTVDGLFRMFLKVRIGPSWPGELRRVQAWVTGPAGS